MAAFDVSVIGELNLDIIFYGLPQELVLERELLAKDVSITLGSSSAIFAHNLACLGNKVGFSSTTGSDPFAHLCMKRLAECGVDLSHVRQLSGKTTGLSVILAQQKQRYILTYPGTMFEMSERDLEKPAPDSEDQQWTEDAEAATDKEPAELPLDVDEADAAEQRREVKLDEDDYR